jgi:YidC/Oxa1 family membrane protein insertase
MWDTLILNPMINTLLWIYSILFENFGLAIIAFTILVRLITFPLTAQQIKSTQKMQDLQKSKKWQDMQKKYKDNKEKLSQEQMKLYQEAGVSPFGSCLPTLIQFPIIIGLYQAIIRALAVTPIQLLDLSKHIYPFIDASALIPLNQFFLWMNLSLPEKDWGITLFGFGIPILAIIVVITSYLQTKLMTPASATPDQGAQMSRAMNLYMPLFMGYLAYTFSSGLALYFVTSNVVGILQYGLMGRLDWRNLIPGNLLPGRSQTEEPAEKSEKKKTSK